LPVLPALSEVVNRMVDRVRADGGKARAFTVTLTSAAAAVDACRTALAGFEAKSVAADTADEAQQARTRDQGPSGTGVS
jgi:hypothetical protein